MEKNCIIRDESEDIVLRPGEIYTFVTSINDLRADDRCSLYMTGESRFFYAWRDEVDYQHFYGLIDDSLCTAEAESSRYCLDFSMKREADYVKRAVKKIVWKPSLFDVSDVLGETPDQLRCGIFAKAKDLRIGDGGYLRMRFEWRAVREGKPNALTDNPPDRVCTVDIPEGSYGYRDLGSEFTFPAETTASVTVYLEGRGYSGKVYFERPYMTTSAGYNVLPDFSVSVQNRPFFDWYGCNLSKREWPTFRVTVNGREVFDGECFETMHRYPFFEFDLPADCLKNGNNEISIGYHPDYHDPAPFGIRCLRLIRRDGGELAVIGHGENARLGGEFPILVRTSRDGVSVSFDCNRGDVECPDSICFEKAGLHTFTVIPRAMKNDLSFDVLCGGERHRVTVPHVCRKADDRVVTGTGDAVYVNFDSPEFFEKFFEWYVSLGIGELLTLRPIYRWGGTRGLDGDVWKNAARLMNGMNMKYSMMIDGRDVPGYDKNPTANMIGGKGYVGHQLHERDGQFFYWNYRKGEPRQNFQILDEFYDICMRLYRESPDTMNSAYKPCNVKMSGGKYCLRTDTDLGYDMKDLAEAQARQLCDIRDLSTRHTGPAVNFRSFFKAGFKWLGSETMYSKTEMQLAFLRGASKAYGSDSFGVHAAVQWCSRPHDSAVRNKLYRLALYVPYMLGANEINTEEGLWRIEAGYSAYDRYSDTCKMHLETQRDFNRYVTSHERRGSFYTPIALVYGRDDTWTGYHTSSGVICGCLGMPSGDLATSWRLLNVFFPNADIEKGRRYELSAEKKTDMYSETPYGNIDVIPVEKGRVEGYRLISFVGYNRAHPDDTEKMLDFVRGGGRLLIGLPHLSDEADIREIRAYRHGFSDNALLSSFGGVPRISEDTYKGKPLHVSVSLSGYDEIVERTDSGAPLAVTKRLGEGEIVFVNALEYPGNESVSEIYERLLTRESERATAAESVWVDGSEGVEFSVYDCGDGTRYIYLIAVDLFRNDEYVRHASLRVGECRYDVGLTFGKMIKIAVKDGIAAWLDSERGEICGFEDGKLRVSGKGSFKLFAAKNGALTETEIVLAENSETVIHL